MTTSPEEYRGRDGTIEYRLTAGDGPLVVMMHGAHMHAGIRLGEEVYRALGHAVLVPSRPGYGATSPFDDVGGFVTTLAELIGHLGRPPIAAVVGISAGGREAIDLAGRHPDLVEWLILQSSVSSLPWPDPVTRMAGRLLFGHAVQHRTWAATRALIRRAPSLGLTAMMGSLSSRPTRQVVAELDESSRQALLELFAGMRSDRGFSLDLSRHLTATQLAAVTQPTLVMASLNDGSVGPEHARDLASRIPLAQLQLNETSSHLMWFGPGSEVLSEQITSFLNTPVT